MTPNMYAQFQRSCDQPSDPWVNDPCFVDSSKPVSILDRRRAAAFLRARGRQYQARPPGHIDQVILKNESELLIKAYSDTKTECVAHITSCMGKSFWLGLSEKYPIATIDKGTKTLEPTHQEVRGAAKDDIMYIEIPRQPGSPFKLFSSHLVRQVSRPLFHCLYSQRNESLSS